MSSPSYGSMYPRTAYLLSMVGGALIALYGLVEVREGVVLRTTLESFLPGASGLVIALGVLGIAFGAIIVVMSTRLRSHPISARRSGMLIVVVSLISFFGGGGFLFVGLLLALVGGILAMRWSPPVPPQPVYSPAGYGLLTNQPTATTRWGPPAAPPLRPGTAQRFCPSCGSPNAAIAQFCAKCGAPMS